FIGNPKLLSKLILLSTNKALSFNNSSRIPIFLGGRGVRNCIQFIGVLIERALIPLEGLNIISIKLQRILLLIVN
ncbi:hypothetical protein OFB61_24025, partial [Escherichia coli]|nr:hypothetical protein [Escherichia coli]